MWCENYKNKNRNICTQSEISYRELRTSLIWFDYIISFFSKPDQTKISYLINFLNQTLLAKVLKNVCILIVSMEVFSRLVNWAEWTRTLQVYLSMWSHHGRSLASFYGTRKIGLWRNITVTWHSWVTLTCPSFPPTLLSLSFPATTTHYAAHTRIHIDTVHTHLVSLSLSLWSLILFPVRLLNRKGSKFACYQWLYSILL